MRPGRLIRLRGVRTHNLKGVDLDLPLNRLVAITGVSGSGKSSLAFDTLYAEGQRRYVETFSAYARQFLGRLDKPDADSIEGLPPAVAVGQQAGAVRRSDRSTVGTVTEVHDHLALLFAKAGVVVCGSCGERVEPSYPQDVSHHIESLPDRTRYLIAFPLDLLPGSDRQALAEELRRGGYTRARVGGAVVSLDAGPLPGAEGAQVEVVVDRLVRGVDPPERRRDSIETAFARGLGRCVVVADDILRQFYQGWRCGTCGRDYLAPEPRLFRYNSPLGACPTCEGTGVVADPDGARAAPRRGVASRPCPDCHGARLRPEALAVRVGGRNVAEVAALRAREAAAFLGALGKGLGAGSAAVQSLTQLLGRLKSLEAIGLDYLTLDRPAGALSGGEAHRLALTSALGSGLVNALYVLDEPSAGLHPGDLGRLVAGLQALRDAGNTVVVVEHNLTLVRASDLVVDLGPGAGKAGGRLLYCGPPAGLESREAGDGPASPTADHLSGRARRAAPGKRRAADRGALKLLGASGHNLQGIDVSFPLGLFVVVTGVSGSGKSTLVADTLYPAVRERLGLDGPLPGPSLDLLGADQLDAVVLLDQAPISRSSRSNPVTFLKAFDEVRKTFAATHEARARNYGPSKFSFNVPGGRCDACEGHGFTVVDMQFLPDVLARCEACRGTRYRAETLEVTYRGRNIAEALDLTAREAFGFFKNRPAVQARLRPLLDVGLDYLRLGQPAPTLSGGESQRLKLASFLASSPAAIARAAGKGRTLFLLDEPTAGLHPADTAKLLDALSSLLTLGHSLVVVEHGLEVMARADWIIDLGPGAGDAGGRVVAEGTPEAVAQADTPTGRALAAWL